MNTYDIETLNLIPGTTPREKFQNMEKIIALLSALGYPRRGTPEDYADLSFFATQAQQILPQPKD